MESTWTRLAMAGRAEGLGDAGGSWACFDGWGDGSDRWGVESAVDVPGPVDAPARALSRDWRGGRRVTGRLEIVRRSGPVLVVPLGDELVVGRDPDCGVSLAADQLSRRHVRIARWTLPLWIYVSITGVIIYLMLYRLY